MTHAPRDPGEEIILRLLKHIGEDPSREGLRDTPRRVMAAWKKWTSGYAQDPAGIFKTFKHAKADGEMVILRGIPVVSKCEHHLADIIGTADIGYIPDGRIAGLSKLARLVDIFSRRLQVQERLTAEIADALMQHLRPLGAGVIIRATHACMSTRGVGAHTTLTTTCVLRGSMESDPALRQEFITLCQK